MKKQEKVKYLRNSKSIIILSILISVIILLGIIIKPQMVKERKVIKEMTENEQVTNLQTQINNLQASQTEYANSVQAAKNAMATSLISKGIQTSNTDSLQTIAGKIDTIKVAKEDNTVIGPVAGGSYDNPYIPTGFRHFRGNGTWNDGYVIEEEATGNQFVWVPCVTDQSKVKSGDTVVTFGKKTDTTKYKPSSMTITGEEGTTASEIEASVATYGGFYIARYEAGISGTTENYSLSPKTATDGSVKPLSKPGCGVWNSISRANAITVSNCMIDTAKTGAKSALISGAAWDTTLQWIVNASDNKNNEPNLGYDTNSTENGWYSDISNSTRHLTGYYAVNNIYDMAGNVCDWTTENCTYSGVSYVLSRGGHCNNSGSDIPAAYRFGSTDYASNYLGFRVVLYK